MVIYNLSMKEAEKNITSSRTAWLHSEFKTILDYLGIDCLKYMYILYMMKYRITCFSKTVSKSEEVCLGTDSINSWHTQEISQMQFVIVAYKNTTSENMRYTVQLQS